MPGATTFAEPAWQDLIDDPIIKLLMQKDGIGQEGLRELLEEAALRLKQKLPSPQ